jgi:hypothetical protein
MRGRAKLSTLTRNGILAPALVADVAPPSSLMAWRPCLSIETPVNRYDPAARGAFLLLHTYTRPRSKELVVLTGTVDGLVRGKRESVRLRFEGEVAEVRIACSKLVVPTCRARSPARRLIPQEAIMHNDDASIDTLLCDQTVLGRVALVVRAVNRLARITVMPEPGRFPMASGGSN